MIAKYCPRCGSDFSRADFRFIYRTNDPIAWFLCEVCRLKFQVITEEEEVKQ